MRDKLEDFDGKTQHFLHKLNMTGIPYEIFYEHIIFRIRSGSDMVTVFYLPEYLRSIYPSTFMRFATSRTKIMGNAKLSKFEMVYASKIEHLELDIDTENVISGFHAFNLTKNLKSITFVPIRLRVPGKVRRINIHIHRIIIETSMVKE